METQFETFWVFALLSKCCCNFTSQHIIATIFLVVSAYLLIHLLHWTYPGGPAWGKFHSTNTTNKNSKFNPIPGPRGFPVLGSFNLMASHLAHRKLASEAIRLGAKRLMAFSLGETRVVITSNPDVAKEILNSSVFVDRPVKESAYSLMFHRAIGFAKYGVYWRTLRRIAATHLFSPKQINNSAKQRFEIASQISSFLFDKIRSGEEIRIREVLKRASLNNMMCSVFGREYKLGSANKESEELSALVEEGYEVLGILNWSDHLPWLAGFDPQLIRSRCSVLTAKVNRFVGRIISEHVAQPKDKNKDFVDVLLSLQGPDKLNNSDMIAVLWEMIFRGTDTVAILIEWILARMVLHPEIQLKVQNELDQIIGRTRRVAESDISAITYLPAVIKEVLRLHPPGPLLSWARLAIKDTVVDGRTVPAGTTAMVNMWAITRDPDIWSDPQEFKPEGFLSDGGSGMEFSVMGSDLRLAPFGSGRRSCPGKALGLATVTFWVASLLHQYEWRVAEGNMVDLSETLKMSCEMTNPLTVKLCPRCE